MKRILGLDLGTTSIGWAYVHEAENEKEESGIIRTGVRVVPLSSDEENNFENGRSITLNADRTEKRQARRNRFRYQLRRDQLIKVLQDINFLNYNSKLTETGHDTTFETHRLRAKAVTEKLGKEEFARVLLAINKKRGYKSNRKSNNREDGNIIDEMDVAKYLFNNNITPAEYSIELIKKEITIPQFYRSDLENEKQKIWDKQSKYYPELFTEMHYTNIDGENKTNTVTYFKKELSIERIELKGSRAEKKNKTYELRVKGLSEKLSLSEFAHVIAELNNEINQSSGYLSEISDRSKELYFNDETVGQYQYRLLKENKHTPLTNHVFYRTDYENEFEEIWKEQSKHYPELSNEVKEKIKDRTIFYQRRLRSQKGLISICEFEGKERIITLHDGKKKKKLVGPRVVPKSSPVFQEFRIWQNINNIEIKNKKNPNEKWELDENTRNELFKELNWKGKKNETQFLTWLFSDSDEDKNNWTTNFSELVYNTTNNQFLDAFIDIIEMSGHDRISKNQDVDTILDQIKSIFEVLDINTKIVSFDSLKPGNQFDQQPHYQLWHLLYSYETDQSKTGIKSLVKKLKSTFGFGKEFAQNLSFITFEQDYGNLSAKAIKKIMPHLQDGCNYSEACSRAGYRHSNYLTKEENLSRILDDSIEILERNSLRNPVVEKILNQMIHVVNGIIENEEMGRPDEIRIELTRDLKQTQEQRNETTKYINKATKYNNELRKELYEKVGLDFISKKDLVKYKLYKELEPLGFKTLYSNTYIELKELFTTNKFDVEHIIPQSKLFDDSFTNKTLETREANIKKGNMTAIDFVEQEFGIEEVENYKLRINELYDAGSISNNKKKKLFTTDETIPKDFLNRDIGNTAYISRKAMELLLKVCYSVVPTAGKITSTLREDWELIQVMQELNWDKYDKQGLTYHIVNKEGKKLPRIKDWNKRNDHRHHAMDAIAIAFTKRSFIQYLNNLNAKSDKNGEIYGIQKKYTNRDKEGKRKFKKPFKNIREESKKHLENILVSFKAKNKVTTINTNKINVAGKRKYKTQDVQTPRGQLHKETIYGQSKIYKTKLEKVGSKFDKDLIATVANKQYRNVLLNRLNDFNGNAKNAFTGKNSLSKNPLYTKNGEKVPEKVKTVNLEEQFTIRKEIVGSNPTSKQIVPTPKKIKKVVDAGIRKILEKRLKEYDGNPKEAFSNLESNPIWQNKEKGIAVKRVAITGISNGEPIHFKKDHLGEFILNEDGKKNPVDFVQTGNNHHVAIYKDKEGNLYDQIVTFYEAVERKNQGIDVIQKETEEGYTLLFTLKQNEMFVFPSNDFDPNEVDLLDPRNKSIISKHIYRVQKISRKVYSSVVRDYVFRHHLETEIIESNELKNTIWKPIKSLNHLEGLVKVRMNHLGDIVQIGEY